jgi:hypothetical protein
MAHPGTGVTGRRIILEILQEMRDNLHPLLFSRVAPRLYYVYLHPDDFAAIEGIVPRIRAEAQRALDEEVRRVNAPSTRVAIPWLTANDEPPVEEPGGGWEIHVEPDRDGEMAPGDFLIVSKLTIPAPPEFEGGAPTTRVFRTIVSGEKRTTTEPVFEATPGAGQPRTAPAGEAAHAAGTRPVAHGLARFTFEDDRGRQTFVMEKADIKIGRGGQYRLVDLRLEAPARVSRVHARVRRDDRGRFFIKDLSEWGTTVNGRRIERGVERDGETVREIDVEAELPREARIGLADLVFLEFRAETP